MHDSGDFLFFTESLGEQTKASAKHQKAARGRRMKARPTQSRKGVKGQLPLAGSRDGVPCGVWGNAPTVPRTTSMPNALNKGAGSEASLPVTLRVRRRASKLLFPQDSVKKRFFCLQAADSPQNREIHQNFFRNPLDKLPVIWYTNKAESFQPCQHGSVGRAAVS